MDVLLRVWLAIPLTLLPGVLGGGSGFRSNMHRASTFPGSVSGSWVARPFAAAVVAAPILKLWPAYFWVSMLANWSAVHRAVTKCSLVRKPPSRKWKRGPGSPPRSAM